MLDMRADLFHKLIVTTQDKSGYLGRRIRRKQGLYERTTETGQTEIEEIGVRIVEIALQRRHINIFEIRLLVEYFVIDHG